MRSISVAVAGLFVFIMSGIAFGQEVSVSQVVCNPSSVNSGASTTCAVTLSGAAPAGGKEVLLSANNSLLPVPNSVIVPAGATSTMFTATAGNVSSNQSATVTATAQNSVLLNWAASVSQNLTNYNVYRGVTSGGPYGVVTRLGLVTTYTDSNVQNGQTYFYVTTAVDNAGAESAYSNEASAILPNGVSRSATISLVAPPASLTLSSLACSPTSLSAGTSTTCAVTLSSAAPNGGTVVGLASNNSLLPMPALSVTVPANAISATFTATAGNIAANQSANLTASLNGVSQTTTINLTAPRPLMLSSLVCNPTNLRSGAVTSCTVTLSQAAPNGGMVLGLASNNNLLTVPLSVTVPVNATSATFTATAGNIGTNQSANLTASLNGASQTTTINLAAPLQLMLSSLVCSPPSLNPGAITTCTVALSGAAPNGGVVVGLVSSNSLLPVPSPSVTVPANATAATFTATAGDIASNQSANLTASLNGALQTATINLVAPLQLMLSSLVCNPKSLHSGGMTGCILTLNQAAPNGDIVVGLASNNNLLQVPAAAVTVRANRSATTFKAKAGLIGQSQVATLTATLGGASRRFDIDLVAGVVPSSLACSPSTIRPETTTVCSVNLSQAAPPGGIVVALASNNGLLTVPPSVTVGAGSSSATFSATASQLTKFYQPVKIVASFGGGSASAFVTIQRGRAREGE